MESIFKMKKKYFGLLNFTYFSIFWAKISFSWISQNCPHKFSNFWNILIQQKFDFEFYILYTDISVLYQQKFFNKFFFCSQCSDVSKKNHIFGKITFTWHTIIMITLTLQLELLNESIKLFIQNKHRLQYNCTFK